MVICSTSRPDGVGWTIRDRSDVRWAAFGDFDTAMMSPAGDVAAVVDSDGTKALLIEPGGHVVRELNRSWYCATAYRYPLALFTLPDGRTAVAHCPERYNRIEIDVALTGERLTGRAESDAADLFHARLQVSADGRTLLSAGWVWHPLGVAALFDIDAALKDPRHLDRALFGPGGSVASPVDAEVAGACWIGDDVVVATSDEGLGDGDGLSPLNLARWSPRQDRYLWNRRAPADLGDLLSLHGDVLTLNGHPRLFSGNSGELLAEWPDLQVPATAGCLMLRAGPRSGAAMVAVDPDQPRFAVAQHDRVVVLEQVDEPREGAQAVGE